MPDLADNHTANEKRIWDHRVTEMLKAKRTLENNLHNLFAKVMSLCDSDTKNQIQNMTEYLNEEAELDSIKLLGMIKQLISTGGTNDLNKIHNRAMAHLNLMNLHQDRFQDIQEFCDQYIALKKVCVRLGLRFARCKEHALAILKEKAQQNQARKTSIRHLTNLKKSITQSYLYTKLTEQDTERIHNK